MHLYEVKLIHRVFDWDASFSYAAANARQARKWALYKLTHPENWLIVSAKRKTK